MKKNDFKLIKRTFVSVLLCFSMHSYAQFSLSGTVIDELNTKIENVTVKVLTQDSVLVSGTATDKNGRFYLNSIDEGFFILNISCIGYKERIKNLHFTTSNIELGSIMIATNIHDLKEISIVANQFVKRNDGMLIYPKKTDIKAAGSGYDVIYNIMIPGITVDRTEGKVTRLGEAVSLFINGEKAEFREIQNLRTSKIEKIEYIDIPSGIYIQENAVINIILKDQTTGGYFSIDGKQNLGYQKDDYNVTVQYNKSNISYSFFCGYNNESSNNSGSYSEEKFYFPSYEIDRQVNSIEDRTKKNNQYTQFSVKSANSKRRFSAKISLIRMNIPDNETKKNIFYSNSIASVGEASSRNSEKNVSQVVNLYSGFSLPNAHNIDVYINGSYSDNKYTRNYEEGSFSTYTNIAEDFYNFNTSINYTKQFQNRNTISAYVLENYRKSNSKYTGSTDYLQGLTTNETLIFAGYNHIFGSKWIFNSRIGISWLRYKLKENTTENNYFPRFNTVLRYSISQKQGISLQVNVGNSFPTASSLNNVEQYIDPIITKRGNPQLDMAKLYNMALMYNAFGKKINMQTMLINNIYIRG